MEAHLLILAQLRNNAADCIRLAEAARTSGHKSLFIEMAERWLTLAERAERRGWQIAVKVAAIAASQRLATHIARDLDADNEGGDRFDRQVWMQKPPSASTRSIRTRSGSWQQRRAIVAKGLDIELAPLDEDHVRAKITWSEQDVGGGKLVIEVTVKNMKTRPKTDDQLKSDATALAVRFARAFADTIEN
jgi:hypothetical protein